MIPCPICSLPIVLTTRGAEEAVFCAGCRRLVKAVGWPALDRDAGAGARPQAVMEGEASCFSCTNRAATSVCDACGCFTCPACEAKWLGESLCLACLHARRELQAAPRFQARALIYDNMALGLLLLPILIIPFYGVFFSVLASPVALYLVIRHWHTPRGLPPRGPFRSILAGSLALVLLTSVVGGIGYVAYTAIQAGRVIDRMRDETSQGAVVSEPGTPVGEGTETAGETGSSDEP